MPRRRVPKALALFLLVRTFVFATDTAPPLSFTRLADIRSLSPVEAERGHPAEVHGIITYVNPDTGSLFVQDGADDIYVFISESKADVPPQRGQRVTVKGITTAGRFAPSLTKATITVDGFGGLPAPKKLEFDYLMAGREDSLLDEVSGIVRSGQIIGTQLWLGIASNGGAFLARVRIFPHDWKLRLVDATVTVRGVIASTYNDHRQSIGMQMMVSDAGDIHILVPPQPDVFKLPVSPTTAGGGFRRASLDHRIHVRGTIIGVESGIVYVADANGSLAVESRSAADLRAGDSIDIAGFPGAVDGRPGLQDAVWRIGGTPVLPVPRPIRGD